MALRRLAAGGRRAGAGVPWPRRGFRGAGWRAAPPHTVLGVSAQASQEEVRQAFLGLAKKYHPDVNPDPTAHEEFVRVQAAYLQMLRGADADSTASQAKAGQRAGPRAEPPPHGRTADYSQWGFGDASADWNFDGWPHSKRWKSKHAWHEEGWADYDVDDDGDWEDEPPQPRQAPRPPVTKVLHLTLAEGILGCRKHIDLSPPGAPREARRMLEVRIPPNTTTGEQLRLGHRRLRVVLKVRVQDDDLFRPLGGLDVAVAIPLSLTQAVLGTVVSVPVVNGPAVKLTVPPGTKPGDHLVLRGQGLKAYRRRHVVCGNLRVTWVIQLPREADLTPRQRAALQDFAQDEAVGNAPLRHPPEGGGDRRPRHRKEKPRRRRGA